VADFRRVASSSTINAQIRIEILAEPLRHVGRQGPKQGRKQQTNTERREGDDGKSEHSGPSRQSTTGGIMTAPSVETQTNTELKANAKMMRKRAVEEETKWRMAHGFDTRLRGKQQVEAKRKRQPLERGEVRRRKERERQRVERQVLARPLLKGVEGHSRE
jgi:hypothetical protein